ncbi:MAG: hypothetical protein Q8O19_01590, partial [Rectinemataceae bacterium]|nr:hypothetical protein [Rectinemataceae bacterium]
KTAHLGGFFYYVLKRVVGEMEKPSGDGFSSTFASLLTGAGELANVRVLYPKRFLVSIPSKVYFGG